MPMELSVARSGGIMLIRARKSEPPLPVYNASERMLAEFGSDLAVIRHAIDEIASRGCTEDRRADQASRLYRSFFRLRRLHRHLTLTESISSGSVPCAKRLTEIGQLCSDLCDSVANMIRPMNYSLRYQAASVPCYAMLDPDLIEAMLLNIITNSLMYTKQGGEILVSLAVSGERCVVAVDDPGSGISEEKLSGVMSGGSSAALTDTKAGAGLGLYVARGIAEAHGGTVILESREGKGTCVRVSLPRMSIDGIEVLSQPYVFRHLEGMHPILTELSVFLNREYFKENLLD